MASCTRATPSRSASKQRESALRAAVPARPRAALRRRQAARGAAALGGRIRQPAARRAAARRKSAMASTVDSRLLSQAMDRSRIANGALEVAQAGNELTGLSVKQALALQSLLAAQHRAETLKAARDLASEEEARQRFKTFLGSAAIARQAASGTVTSTPTEQRRDDHRRAASEAFARHGGQPWTTSPSSTASPRPSAATSIPASACIAGDVAFLTSIAGRHRHHLGRPVLGAAGRRQRHRPADPQGPLRRLLRPR